MNAVPRFRFLASRPRFSSALLVAAILSPGPGAMARAADSLSKARIDEVAAWLPEQPAGIGPTIAERTTWKRLASRAEWKRIVQEAERAASRPLPDSPDDLFLDFSRTGNRRRWERVASDRRDRVRTLALAECLEAKGRFVAPLEEVIRALCAEKTWVMPAHDRSLSNFRQKSVDIDLGSSMLAWSLAGARHLLGPRLDAGVRKLLVRRFEERIFTPFRDMVRGKRAPNWWLLTTNNWNAVCLAGVTGTALATVADRRDRALFVVAAESYSRNFLRGFTPDGYCSEGVGYWNYGFGHYALLADAIARATGGRLELLAREAARAPALYGTRIEILGGVFPAFADCSVTARPAAELLTFIDRRLPLRLAPESRADLSRPHGSLYTTLSYAFADPGLRRLEAPSRPAASDRAPLRTWFPDAGVLISRPAPGSPTRLAVALKGGHNGEHHNHNDVGSFIVVLEDRPVLADPGAEVYTARTFSSRRYESGVLSSWGHPVPVVAGKLQRTGSRARGVLLEKELTRERDRTLWDLRSAYDVPELRKLERELVYSREGAGSLLVEDRVELSEAATFATALVTFGEIEKRGPGLLVVREGSRALEVRIDTGDLPHALRAETIDEDVHAPRKPTRIGIELESPVRAARVRLTITPAGS